MANKTIDVLDAKGKKAGSVELPAELFDVETNIPLIHQVVVAQRAAARQGTHKVKNRGEVSGSGVKPFKQKGTGRARQGSIRMPQHKGGGIVHGPVPRDYAQRTPKKMIAAALRGTLSDRARADRIHAVEAFVAGDAPSTKTVRTLLDTVGAKRRVLVVHADGDVVTYRSARNLADVHVITWSQLNAYDVLVAEDIVFTREALEALIAAKTKKVEVDA